MIRKLIGTILIIIGVLLGLALGVLYCFIGGWVDIFYAVGGLIHASGNYGALFGWGLLKIVASGIVGWGSAMVFIIPGWALLDD